MSTVSLVTKKIPTEKTENSSKMWKADMYYLIFCVLHNRTINQISVIILVQLMTISSSKLLGTLYFTGGLYLLFHYHE